MTSVIIAFGLLYFVGHVLTHLFDRVKIPDVLILITFGIIMGPVLNIVNPDDIGPTGRLFTAIALIIILFEGGTDIEVSNLLRSAKQALLLTSAFFFITAAIIYCIMHYGYDYSVKASLVTGFICGGTSAAVVIPLVGALKMGKEAATILILESALTDVLCIVCTLGVLQSVEHGEIEVTRIVSRVFMSLVIASLIGFLGGVVWLCIVNKVRKYPNTQFATFAFMFIVYGVAEMLDFSGAIASLAFGIILGNNKFVARKLKPYIGNIKVGLVTEAEKSLYKEIVFLLKIFFFIYLGLSFPIGEVHFVMISLSLVVAIFVARPLASKLFVKRNVDAYDRSIVAVMVPKGLAAAVLAGLPAEYNMIQAADIQAITFNVVLISILATSVFILLVEKTSYGTLMKHLMSIDSDYTHENSNDAINKYGDPLRRL
ncbi:MAG: cation:proton antiporter [Bacteroidales bacterium]|nr:cation:proton antiporter [Bacteroidales bacterium]